MKHRILCVLTLCLLCLPLQAYAQEVNSRVNIEVTYSKGITPQESDDFVISYQKNDDKQQIQINTSAKEQSTIFLEEGTYEIMDIEYKGDNEQIKEQGYVVSESFQAQPGKEAYDQIRIGIGTEAGAAVIEKEAVVSKLEERKPIANSSNKKGEDSSNKDESTVEDMTENKNSSKELTASVDKSEENQNNKDTENVQQSVKIDPIKKGIPLLILMVGTFGVVWCFHKKGKI